MLNIDKVENAYSLYDLNNYALEPLLKGGGGRWSYNYNYGVPFLGYYYFKLSLADPCSEVEKKFFKEIMHFH